MSTLDEDFNRSLGGDPVSEMRVMIRALAHQLRAVTVMLDGYEVKELAQKSRTQAQAALDYLDVSAPNIREMTIEFPDGTKYVMYGVVHGPIKP